MPRRTKKSVARKNGKGVGFYWIPAAPVPPKRRGPGKGIPDHFEEGRWNPVNDWMRSNGGSVPEERLFTFGGSGANVALADIQCGQTYYTMYKAAKAVRRCPAPALVLRQLIRKARARVFAAALRVRRACLRKPDCQAVIELQVRAWGCDTLGRLVNGQFVPQRYEAWSGYVYRIECFHL